MSKSNNDFIKTEANLKKILNTVPLKNHLKIDTCNDFVLPELWGFKDRVNSNFHIAFIRKGSGSYYFEDEKIDMEKGRLFFISSGFKHSRTLNLKDIPTIALLRFNIYDNKTLQPAKRDFEPFAFSYMPKNSDRCNELITRLIRIFKSSSDEFDSLMCGSILTELIFEIYKEIIFLNDSGNAIDPRLKKAMDYARDNICRELLIDKMVEISGLSKNHFRSLFKKNVGMTPKAYIINEKIKEAKVLLAESDCSIKQVAEMIGYPDQYSFSKQFKSITGYAPSIYHKHLG